MKKLLRPFFCIIEYNKRQGTTYGGTQGILTSIVQIISFFL